MITVPSAPGEPVGIPCLPVSLHANPQFLLQRDIFRRTSPLAFPVSYRFP